ncbi:MULTISPECIES: glycine--tRNA ligase subunit beta [unclassified Pseudodesulfovibrio]|uniref:glycine--tRNA ligase subunit beta n=1 Tax=unclassified Pseudodesulfovibrio TaxID=2661612 RepID=UPI000FEB8BD7|nr:MULTISPECIES: glycine--tRNA ligase subunit beta [unclassified Pseudodesulfovibrio]MCJ2163758.1 glycine--tRNA ligase subunit beta [Pseudodesulfovibrio sp. S3-i]RWU05992.1 glycine--tRNA ligase subunit beta [Pseudodesulfovibrio sp. S3]
MAEFILEIGTEEMPARFVPKLADELEKAFAEALTESMVENGGVKCYATPRRITAHVASLAVTQLQEEETVTGPPVRIAYDGDGNLTKAGQGFAKTQGVAEDALFKMKTDKGEYLAAKKTVGGGKTADILPAICTKCIESLSFPKKMRWGGYDFAFGRPVRWLLALLDSEVIEFTLENLTSGRETRGHRVMGFGPFAVNSASEYFSIVRDKGKVVIDPEERKKIIVDQGNRLAGELGGEIVWNEGLLDEVANLVEYPKPLIGDIDKLYLELPREVLLTSMQSHQKSFGVQDGEGNLLPHFLTTLNLDPLDVALVKKGWERVLKARLEDARFFWEADCKVDFKVWLDKLENVVFLGPLGSVGDKSRRIKSLCAKLIEKLGESKSILPGEYEKFAMAGRLAKADLVSEMVIEFDSLQGKMGGIYAERAGKGEIVSSGIYEQYLPAGPDSPVPSSLSGALVSMADKVDTMAGCFGLGKVPTGANDPYALRRCALGIARIIMEHELNVDLGVLLKWAQEAYTGVKWKIEKPEALAKLKDFFGQRLRALFIGQGFDTRVVDAALGAGFSDIRTLKARLEALGEFSREADFEQAVLTFKRAANIIRKQGDEAGQPLTGSYDADLFEDEHEQAFGTNLEALAPRFDDLWENGDFAGLFGLLGELRPSVDGFFDNVMVMCDEVDVRLNRLNLLKALVDRLSRLADFNALQV